jgi:hypothetical protein
LVESAVSSNRIEGDEITAITQHAGVRVDAMKEYVELCQAKADRESP